MMNINKNQAISLLTNRGVNSEKLNQVKDTDIVDITQDKNTASETFGKFLINIQSENYDLMKELYSEEQEEGAYSYRMIL